MAKPKKVSFDLYSIPPKCGDGDPMEVILYDPVTKEVINASAFPVPSVDREPIEQKVIEALAATGSSYQWRNDGLGTLSKQFRMYSVIPDFMKVYNQLVKGLKAKFKKGDRVYMRSPHQAANFGIIWYKVEKHIGWYMPGGMSCNQETGEYDDPEPVYLIAQEVSGIMDQATEGSLHTEGDYAEFMKLKDDILALKRKMKAAGMVAEIMWEGKLYRCG